MASCLRVARLAATTEAVVLRRQGGDPAKDRAWLLRHFGPGVGGASPVQPRYSSCSVGGEECCAFDVTEDEYTVVWSLGLNSGADTMCSALSNEVQVMKGLSALIFQAAHAGMLTFHATATDIDAAWGRVDSVLQRVLCCFRFLFRRFA